MHRFRRLQHHRRQQHSSQSDHDGSESDECIHLSSSSSASNGHGSASSDSESDNGDSLPGAWKARSLKNDDDSDNDSTSSSNEDSESDSDEDGVNTKSYQSGAAIRRSIRMHNQFKYNNDGKETFEEPLSSSHDTNRPLSPWKNSSSKARIIDDLKNNNSSIHTLVGLDWEANLDELWKQYAPRYERTKFRGYMKTIMKNYSEKKGPFKGDCNAQVPTNVSCSLSPWEESKGRKRLISELKNYRSTIHALVQDWEKKENLDRLWQDYGSQYQRSKFRGYMETIMKNFRAKKGEFKDSWYAKKDGIHSKEYSLLYKLMVKDDIGDVSRTIDCTFFFRISC